MKNYHAGIFLIIGIMLLYFGYSGSSALQVEAQSVSGWQQFRSVRMDDYNGSGGRYHGTNGLAARRLIKSTKVILSKSTRRVSGKVFPGSQRLPLLLLPSGITMYRFNS